MRLKIADRVDNNAPLEEFVPLWVGDDSWLLTCSEKVLPMTKRTMGKEQQMESEGGATRVGVVAVRYLEIGDGGCGLLNKQCRVGSRSQNCLYSKIRYCH